MTWSLRVSNGDLVLNKTSFDVVAHENKLVQDLRHYILERMGTDPLHPAYGSILDGGVQPNGVEAQSVIAQTNWSALQLEIEAELRRIVAAYQRKQVERAKNDRLRFDRSTLTTREVLLSLNNVEFNQQADALHVRLYIQNGIDEEFGLEIALPPVITR